MLTARYARVNPSIPIARTVDQFVESMLRSDFPAFGVGTRPFPVLNAWEDTQNMYVEAELPGFAIGDLDISITGSELTISGTRAVAQPEGATFYRRERPSGKFSRTVRVGADIDARAITASLTNGVLTVTLPKAEAAKPRKIDVTVR
jgi:HSP20 family protein